MLKRFHEFNVLKFINKIEFAKRKLVSILWLGDWWWSMDKFIWWWTINHWKNFLFQPTPLLLPLCKYGKIKLCWSDKNFLPKRTRRRGQQTFYAQQINCHGRTRWWRRRKGRAHYFKRKFATLDFIAFEIF